MINKSYPKSAQNLKQSVRKSWTDFDSNRFEDIFKYMLDRIKSIETAKVEPQSINNVFSVSNPNYFHRYDTIPYIFPSAFGENLCSSFVV